MSLTINTSKKNQIYDLINNIVETETPNCLKELNNEIFSTITDENWLNSKNENNIHDDIADVIFCLVDDYCFKYNDYTYFKDETNESVKNLLGYYDNALALQFSEKIVEKILKYLLTLNEKRHLLTIKIITILKA